MVGAKFELASPFYINHEDLAPNPVHTILLLAAIMLTVIGWRRQKSADVLRYWCAWLTGIVLFAAILKWQVYGVRLQLPGYVLAAPGLAMAYGADWRLRGLQLVALLGVFVYGGFAALLFNGSRPLLSHGARLSYLGQTPLQRLYANQPTLLDPYAAAVDLLVQSKAQRIGLVINDWEFPIWRMLRDRKLGYPIRIEHIQVVIGPDKKAQFRPYGAGALSWPLGPFVPDAVIWARSDVAPPQLDVDGQELVRRGPPGPIVVFTRNP